MSSRRSRLELEEELRLEVIELGEKCNQKRENDPESQLVNSIFVFH